MADDPDAVGAQIAPHALHEADLYARWESTLPGSNPYEPIDDADALRAHVVGRARTVRERGAAPAR